LVAGRKSRNHCAPARLAGGLEDQAPLTLCRHDEYAIEAGLVVDVKASIDHRPRAEQRSVDQVRRDIPGIEHH
jgi:hypothetical protein